MRLSRIIRIQDPDATTEYDKSLELCAVMAFTKKPGVQVRTFDCCDSEEDELKAKLLATLFKEKLPLCVIFRIMTEIAKPLEPSPQEHPLFHVVTVNKYTV